MASITQNQAQSKQSAWSRFKVWLNELEFVTFSFTWLFRLMSRVAEPLMTFATIYVIVEAGVPSIAVTLLHKLAIGIMISAPEIILPGGFILASEIKAQGNKHYKALYLMCWLFVILTSATLADLFIWHFTGLALAALMWSRCAAAVGYSILFRVITYKREIEVMPVTDVLTRFQAFTDQMVSFQQMSAATERRLKEMDLSFSRQIERLTESVTVFQSSNIERRIESLTESVHVFQSETFESLTETLQRVESAFQSQVIESLSPLTETLDVHAEMLSVLPMLVQQIDAMGASTQLELRTVTEEFRQVRVTVEKQAQALPRLAERVAHVVDAPVPVKPRLSLPAKRNEMVVASDFDKKQFVFECLTENADMTISEIQRRAAERGQSLSVGTASDYRKKFQNRFQLKGTESETESLTENGSQAETESD